MHNRDILPSHIINHNLSRLCFPPSLPSKQPLRYRVRLHGRPTYRFRPDLV